MHSSVIHRNLAKLPPEIVEGKGHYLISADGKHYFDACGGAAVSCLGHDDQAIQRATMEQYNKVAYAHTGFFTNEPAENLAAKLASMAPEGFGQGRVMYLGSGSEAMEAALKLARQHFVEKGETSRTKFIARNMAYHGNTIAALSTGGHQQRRKPYEPLLLETGRIPACYAYRLQAIGESEGEFGLRSAQELEKEIIRLGPDQVAGFVAEPVSGASLGCVPPAKGYFRAIREICDRYGILFIADEVMCGMGRTGSMFALAQEGVHADLYTIAKGLGAGYVPIAATMASEFVLEPIFQGSKKLWNGHTYMSHAASCAGALAVLKIIEEEKLIHHVQKQGEYLHKKLREVLGEHEHVGDIRGRGLFQAFEIVQDRAGKTPFSASHGIAPAFQNAALEAGVMTYPMQGCANGLDGDHVILAPPYRVSEEEIDMVVGVMAETLNKCLPGS